MALRFFSTVPSVLPMKLVITTSLLLVSFAVLPTPADAQDERTFPRFQVPHMAWMNIHKATSLFLDNQCAGSNIIHRGYGKCQGNLGMHVIPHKVTFHDGHRCGTDDTPDEYMMVVPSEYIKNAQTAAMNNLLNVYSVLVANERARNAFKVLDDIDPVNLGFELTADRVCGPYVFPKNTVYIFITPGGNDINFGFAYLGRGEVGMLSIMPDEHLCLYKRTRRRGPGQPPHTSPSPSPNVPASGYELSHEWFQFENSNGVPSCFPLHGINIARPSPTPSPSVTPSLSVSASVSATMTPTSSPTISPGAMTPSALPTPSATASVSMSVSMSPTASLSVGALPPPVPSVSSSSSFMPSSTPAPSMSPTPSRSEGTMVAGAGTVSVTPSIAPSASKSNGATASSSSTNTPTPSASKSIGATASPSSTNTPTPSASKSTGATASPTRTASPSLLVSSTPSLTPSVSIPKSPLPTPSLSLSPSPSPSLPVSSSVRGGGACFPTSARVRLASGKTVTMRELKLGDEVLTHGGGYSAVMLFSHRDFATWTEMVKLDTSSGKTLTLSGSHYIPTGRGLLAARHVHRGELVTVANGSTEVVRRTTARAWSQGLHNPHTMDGWIVVDDVLAWTYTESVAPMCGMGFLTPVRLLHRLGFKLDWISRLLSHGGQSLGVWWGLVPRGGSPAA